MRDATNIVFVSRLRDTQPTLPTFNCARMPRRAKASLGLVSCTFVSASRCFYVLVQRQRKGCLSNDFSHHSSLSSCRDSLYSFTRSERDSAEKRWVERCDHQKCLCDAGGRLDVLWLLDAVLLAAVSRHLRGPAGPALDLSRVRHDGQAGSRQVRPD